MKLMLVGGINDSKAGKIIKLIKDHCGQDVEIVNVNIFTQKPLEVEEESKPDAIVMLNKQKFDFKTTQVIDGLGLIYPQMGQKKTLDAIKNLQKK